MTNDILIGRGDQPVNLLARYANRHGLVAGATGTGKTVSLLVLAEGFFPHGGAGIHGRCQRRCFRTGHGRNTP